MRCSLEGLRQKHSDELWDVNVSVSDKGGECGDVARVRDDELTRGLGVLGMALGRVTVMIRVLEG